MVFGISKQRFANQRKIKRQQSQQPKVEMAKDEVEQKRLGDYVVMPQGIDTAFSKWWRTASVDTVVMVRYPHERHGNAGQPSHSAKSTIMQDFLLFVDVNSQLNGRFTHSSGPTFYFLPKFSQTDAGNGVCSNGLSHNWLKMHWPKVGISPHQEDYCDSCSKFKEEIRAKQTTINCLRQSASADLDEIKKIKDGISALNQDLEQHRWISQESHKYFVDVIKKYATEWAGISEIEQKPSLTSDEVEKVTVMKNKFNLVISADYQMSKLAPYWGLSPQPGSTYYLRQLSHDILGIVNHATEKSAVYLFNETVGPKNTDHTVFLSVLFLTGSIAFTFSLIIRVVLTKIFIYYGLSK